MFIGIEYSGGEAGAYIVADGKTIATVSAPSEEKARSMFIELGAPNKAWYDGQPSSNNDTKKNKTVAAAKTERKNTAAKVLSSVTTYIANNRKAPTGFVYRESGKSKCNGSGTGCNFIEYYLDDLDDDPDGVPYGVTVTENLLDSSKITKSFGSKKSYLSESKGEYTIDGSDPLSEHMIYIIPGAKCNPDNNNAIKGSSKKSVAVLYYLGDDEIYCGTNEG
jgi:hypothetical protein